MLDLHATQSHQEINRMVLRFLSPSSPAVGVELGLHPLVVYRGSWVHGSSRRPDSRDLLDTYQEETIIRPAVELHEAGVRFKRSWTNSLRDVRFRRGVLRVPALCVDDSTEYALLNMMAFERLHAGAGSDVAAYVFFMSNVLGSARDVTLLRSEGTVPETSNLPSVFMFIECILSDTRQTSSLLSVALKTLGKKRTLGKEEVLPSVKKKHSVNREFA